MPATKKPATKKPATPAAPAVTEHTFTARNSKSITIRVGQTVHVEKRGRGVITAITIKTFEGESWAVIEARPLALSAKGKPLKFSTSDITAIVP